MGYDLMGDGTEFSMGSAWEGVLCAARMFGWKPEGCGPSAYYPGLVKPTRTAYERWTSYFGNDGQTVSANDAMNLAQALDRALEEGDHPLLLNDPPGPDGVDHPFYRREGDENRAVLCELVVFCRSGGFAIL